MGCCSKCLHFWFHQAGILVAGGLLCLRFSCDERFYSDTFRQLSFALLGVGLCGVLLNYVTDDSSTEDINEIEKYLFSRQGEVISTFNEKQGYVRNMIRNRRQLDREADQFIELRDTAARFVEQSKKIGQRIARKSERRMQASSSTADSDDVIQAGCSQLHQPSTSQIVVVDIEQYEYSYSPDPTTQVATDSDTSVVDDDCFQLQPSTSTASNVGDVQGEGTPLPQSSRKSLEVEDKVLQSELRQKKGEIQVEEAEDVVQGLQQEEDMPPTTQIQVEEAEGVVQVLQQEDMPPTTQIQVEEAEDVELFALQIEADEYFTE